MMFRIREAIVRVREANPVKERWSFLLVYEILR